MLTAHFTGTQGTPDSVTSYSMGGQYEVKDGATKKYYSIAGMTVAMQDASGLQYLLTDHLGSTAAVTNASGTLTSQQRYLPFGGVRSIPNSPILVTDFGYTGQRLLDAGMGGIMDYKARFYSVALGRFVQPDTIIPDQFNPQSWNRYSYTFNNPIRYNDPDGHCPICNWSFSTDSLIPILSGAVPRDVAAKVYDTVAFFADLMAETADLTAVAISAGISTAGTVVAGPEGTLGGLAAGEFMAAPFVTLGNIAATASWGANVASDILTGDTRAQLSVEYKDKALLARFTGEYGPDTQVSTVTMAAGWLVPISYASLAIQTGVVLYDIDSELTKRKLPSFNIASKIKPFKHDIGIRIELE